MENNYLDVIIRRRNFSISYLVSLRIRKNYCITNCDKRQRNHNCAQTRFLIAAMIYNCFPINSCCTLLVSRHCCYSMPGHLMLSKRLISLLIAHIVICNTLGNRITIIIYKFISYNHSSSQQALDYCQCVKLNLAFHCITQPHRGYQPFTTSELPTL